MEYKYRRFNNEKELTDFFNKLNEQAYSPLNWYKQEGLKIYGCIQSRIIGHCLFIYGKTIRKDEVISCYKNTIFNNIQFYGSSKKYKGLLDYEGKEILNNIYDDISIFYETDDALFLKTRKNKLYGLVSYANPGKGVVEITSPKYENFFDAGEYTFGFIIDNKVGFMSLDGKIIIEPKYKQGEYYNHFFDGKALVHIDKDETIDHYINHYGNFIEYPDNDDTSSFEGPGTSSYTFDDLPDSSDAYEGLADAYWNTD